MLHSTRFKLLTRVSALLLMLVNAMPQAQGSPVRDLEQAKLIYHEAERRFSLGEFQRALELYREAFAKKDLPGFLFNIGQCHFNLGEYSKALFFYDRYLARQPNAPNRAIVEQLVTRAKQELERERQRNAARSASAPSATPSPEPPVTAPPRPLGPTTRAVAQPPGESVSKTPWRWIAIGSGVVITMGLVTAGTITGLLTLSRRDAYLDQHTSLARQRELASSGENLRLTTNLLLGVAGTTAIVTGLYYWLTRPVEHRQSTDRPMYGHRGHPSNRLHALLGLGTVQLRGEF